MSKNLTLTREQVLDAIGPDFFEFFGVSVEKKQSANGRPYMALCVGGHEIPNLQSSSFNAGTDIVPTFTGTFFILDDKP